MKIAFAIGHNESDKGSYSPFLDKSEWDLFNEMRNDLECIGDVWTHDKSIKSYTERCKDISERIGSGYDLTIFLHFNSFNGVANGCEAFYWHSNKDAFYRARMFVDVYSDSTKTSPRGAKPYEKVSGKLPRGAGEVYYAKSTAILLEPFFGDNKEDCEKFDKVKFIHAIKEMIK